MLRTVIAAWLVTMAGCSVLAETNFNECAFEAGKATGTVDNPTVRRTNRDELTHYCMKARGFDVVKDSADKGKASSYKQVGWF
jgi:hypothetical protein